MSLMSAQGQSKAHRSIALARWVRTYYFPMVEQSRLVNPRRMNVATVRPTTNTKFCMCLFVDVNREDGSQALFQPSALVAASG